MNKITADDTVQMFLISGEFFIITCSIEFSYGGNLVYVNFDWALTGSFMNPISRTLIKRTSRVLDT